jgi:glycosyltransferase involved in cell wall biosynthesis
MKITIVMPAYNAAKTIKKTILATPKCYDKIIICDDASQDATSQIARQLTQSNIKLLKHTKNSGYGANQKTLYHAALSDKKTSLIIMVHPDNQYDTSNLPRIIKCFDDPKVDMVLGTRMAKAKQLGMPIWKRSANKFLTTIQNQIYQRNLSEYHTGLRAYRSDLLKQMPFDKFSDNFVFDSETIAWAIAQNKTIKEIPTNCFYTDEVSSISFWPSCRYGLSTLRVLVRFARKYYHTLNQQS